MASYIILFGRETGLSELDVVLLIGCPIACALGTIVSGIVQQLADPPTLSKNYKTFIDSVRDHRAAFEATANIEQSSAFYQQLNKELLQLHQKKEKRWNLWRIPRLAFTGFALGFVVALYFVGAITQDITSVARVMGLCILLGYQAPNIWFLQETLIGKFVEKKILEITKEQSTILQKDRGDSENKNASSSSGTEDLGERDRRDKG